MKRNTGTAGFLPAIVFAVTSAAFGASMGGRPELPAEAYGKVPLSFELNQGQVAPPVEFLARGDGYSILLDSGGMSLRLAGTGRLIKARLVGSNRGAAGEGIAPQAGKVNYFLGQDRRRWLNRIPTYARVRYRQVYEGIDLVYYGKQRRLEYDFVVAPGADPEHIQIAYSGVESLRLDQQGNLLFKGPAGDLVQHRPVAYQQIDGSRKAVPAGYVLAGANRARVWVGSYDRSKPLVIDPVLSYSTYYGGAGDDRAYGIAVDSSGCAYVIGDTASAGSLGSGFAYGGNGDRDIFLIKLDATGQSVVFAAYIGGGNRDFGRGIALDSDGNAYVTGYTYSTDFPVTNGVYQSSHKGQEDAFVLKLNPGGTSILYSTLLGAGSADFGTSIAVDLNRNAYVAGYTSSASFPVTSNAIQANFRGGFYDGFVAKLDSQGSSLSYATYLGGTGADVVHSIAVDSSGYAYVAGQTDSPNFPTQNPMQSSLHAFGDGFFAKLSASGGSLVYSSYLGGEGPDGVTGVAVDSSGAVYLTGSTISPDFPVTSSALQQSLGGLYDAFIAKVNASGSALAYATYLGGKGQDSGYGIAVDSSGNAYVAGATESTDFPTKNAFQAAYRDGRDAFVAKLNSSGDALFYSTFHGGSSYDQGLGIAVDASGGAYVAGFTQSTNLPTTPGVLGVTHKGSVDTFVAKVFDDSPPPSNPTTPTTPTVPVVPWVPSNPVFPSQPSAPSTPTEPSAPWNPFGPASPSSPSTPTTPVTPGIPWNPFGPAFPSTPSTPSTPTDPSAPWNPFGSAFPSTPSAPSTPTEPSTPWWNPFGSASPSTPSTPSTPTPSSPWSPFSP